MSAETIVRDFIQKWNERDFDGLLDMLSEDVEYHNIPMPVVHGREATREFIKMLHGAEQIDWQLHHVAAVGDVVLTERTDNFIFSGGKVSLPVMGTFEIRDGLIAKWRDYFDLGQFQQQMAKLSG